jgi:predicted outer membrane protein
MAPAAVKASPDRVSACNQGNKQMSKTGISGAVALAAVIGAFEARAQTPIPPAPKDFAMAAAQSSQYEIMAAHLALAESQDSRISAFAEEMIKDHMRLGEDLRQAARASGLPPPEPAMSSDQAALQSSLQGLRGADFDKTYAHRQELAHVQAVAVGESFAAAGSDPNLRKAAQSALPTIRDHLKMAQQLRVEVGDS